MVDAVKQDDGSYKNEAGAIVNDKGALLDDDGATINEAGFLINELGQLLNEAGAAVNEEGDLIDKDNELIEDPTDTMIPKRRYDSAASRAKKAETALKVATAELDKINANNDTTGGEPKTTEEFEAKIDDLDVKIEEARKDNDVEEVVKLSKQLRTYERSMFNQIATTAAAGAGTKAQQAVAFDALVEDLEAKYPVFDQDSKEFDQALVDEVLDMHDAFVAKGDAPAAAMAKAVGYILPEQKTSQQRNTDTTKNLDAANRQAPKMGGTGAGSDAGGDDGGAEKVADMTQKEFDALPADTKKRLRGDTYAPS